MPLTDAQCKTATIQADGKPRKWADGQGMYLLVNSTGKYWRMDYRFGDKRKTLSFGVYPEVGLREARDQRDAARKLVRVGLDPMIEKKARQRAAEAAANSSFEVVAKAWFDKHMHTNTPNYQHDVWRKLEINIFP